jgi:PrtD family type I secretion system ABC transporter
MMGAVAVAGAVVSIVLGVWQDRVTRKRLEAANTLNAQSGSFTSLCLRNCESVRAMGMLNGVQSKWDKMNNEVIDLQTHASDAAGILQSIARGVRTSMQVIIYGVGAYLTLKNECTAGVMISSSIIMGRALAPIDQGMATWKQTLEAMSAYKRLDALINKADRAEHMELPDPVGKLDVEGANLAINGQYILRNITFSLEPGEILGLIGPSAAGKSSLSRVLLGIWPSMGGKVRLDGADMFQWDQEHLGKFIGYLPQDVELLPGTVSQNIARFGEIDAEEVIKAAKMAGVHDLILHLPAGYDTLIGQIPGAMVLSGGQRQRVALARALYGNPKLVVLDEPNSSLDEAGEAALMQAIGQLKANRVTTIIVTHKPNILAAVDKILVMQYGQVARFGPRQEFFQPVVTAAQASPAGAAVQSIGARREAVN